jgi:mannose-6-phosphate isomerase-like protein (cupin superfamily)
MQTVNLAKSFRDAVGSLPITVGQVNDSVVRLVRLAGRPGVRTACHRYEREDGLVFVTQGRVQLVLEDRAVPLRTGELMIIPKEVKHCLTASEEVHLMVIEPKSARPAAGCRLQDESPPGVGDARGAIARSWPPYVSVRGLV